MRESLLLLLVLCPILAAFALGLVHSRRGESDKADLYRLAGLVQWVALSLVTVMIGVSGLDLSTIILMGASCLWATYLTREKLRNIGRSAKLEGATR